MYRIIVTQRHKRKNVETGHIAYFYDEPNRRELDRMCVELDTTDTHWTYSYSTLIQVDDDV